MSIKAGVGREDISPKKSIFLCGYPHVERMSTGIHDPLYATALYTKNEGQAAILISLDILFIHHEDVRICREAIARATGVPCENIMITATHTHSGPLTLFEMAWQHDPVVGDVDEEYMTMFRDRIIAAGKAAYENATEATLAVTTAQAEGVGGNRHSKDGVADPEVGLLYFKRKVDGKPLALTLVYSMHPTVMHEDSKLVSSDFPGYTREYINGQIPDVTVLYHTGPSGNLSPRYHVSGQTFAEAKRLGDKLGEAVVKSLEKLSDSDFVDTAAVGAGQKQVTLPPRTFCSLEEAETELAAALAEYEHLKAINAGHGPIRTAECTTFGAEERVALAKAQASGMVAELRKKYDPVEVQVLKIGQAFLVGLPGECFVEYSLEIKKRCPGKAFVISLANGELQGYVVTPDADGYEAGMSFFLPESGPIMVDAAAEIMEAMK